MRPLAVYVSLSLGLCGSAVAANVLLLDGSGSMRRLYEAGLSRDLGLPLYQVMEHGGPVDCFRFSQAVSPNGLSREQLAQSQIEVGGHTELGVAVDFAAQRGYGIAWIVTDNVQHSAGGTEGETNRFYARLRRDDIARVVFFPVLLGGDLPGIAVYGLLLKEADRPAFDSQIAAFPKAVAKRFQTEGLLMKPLDRETIKVQFEKAETSKRGKYRTGQRIHEVYRLRFASRFDHLTITDAEVSIAESLPVFGPNSVLMSRSHRAAIEPRRIRDLGPGEETVVVYTVTVDIEGFDYKKDLVSMLRTLSKPSEVGRLDLNVEITLPQSNFAIRPEYLRRYSAATPAEARQTGKIYGVHHIPAMMTSEVVRIPIREQVEIPVEYPLLPAFLVVAGGILLLGLGAWLLVLVAGHLVRPGPRWQCAARKGDEEVSAVISSDGSLRVNGYLVGRIVGNALEIRDREIETDDGSRVLALRAGLSVVLSRRRGDRYKLTFFLKDRGKESPGSGRGPSTKEASGQARVIRRR